MANTTNFGWETPDDTDLVKDGAAAIRTLGSSIDTSFVDLKGGTTGQVLSKTSNTDLDFTWTSAGGIPATIFDAKGDLIAASAADTAARLAVGTNGQILKANSATSTGLEWGDAPAAAIGQNIIINGNFTINQRAYASGANLSSGTYGFDRWKSAYTNTTLTFTAAPNGQTVTMNQDGVIRQIVEQGNIPAGTYVLSWSGTATGRIYNDGATPPSYAASPVTFTADGLANVVVDFTATGSTKTLSKVKLEVGTTPTAFSFAGGTLAGELAACQRYYERYVSPDNTVVCLLTQALAGATAIGGCFVFSVEKRIVPTITFSNVSHFTWNSANYGSTATATTITTSSRINKRNFGVYTDTLSSAILVAGNLSNVIMGTAGHIEIGAEL
jgi:hypothetical protein